MRCFELPFVALSERPPSGPKAPNLFEELFQRAAPFVPNHRSRNKSHPVARLLDPDAEIDVLPGFKVSVVTPYRIEYSAFHAHVEATWVVGCRSSRPSANPAGGPKARHAETDSLLERAEVSRRCIRTPKGVPAMHLKTRGYLLQVIRRQQAIRIEENQVVALSVVRS